MTPRARTHANRLNALRSTGPRTPAGRARSARNAVKAGLFSKLLVLPALGETADDLDRFRSQIVASLAAVGAAERELADRAAGLMWRLRRVARSEVAAMAGSADVLPPHPDDVRPLGGDGSLRPVPPGAPTAYRLAHVRDQLSFALGAIEMRRAAANALDPAADPKGDVPRAVARHVLNAAGEELGWVRCPDPWPAVLAVAKFRTTDPDVVRWTPARLRRALEAAADGAGLDRSAFVAAVRARLGTEVADLERLTAERRHEEGRLVAQLNEDRATAVAARLYADEALIQRIARAESHLSRELDRVLAMLARVQGGRRADPSGARAAGAVGFVLQNGGCGSAGTPALADA